MELLRINVDIIVASGGSEATLAAKHATTTIPIVMTSGSDPVGAGLIATLARPGGNVTGLTSISAEVGSKRLELLKETSPSFLRVAMLWNLNDPANALQVKEVETAGRALGVNVLSLGVRSANDLDSAFSSMGKETAKAVVVAVNPMFFSNRKRLIELALKSRMPAVYGQRDIVEDGGLMSYGTNLPDLYRRAAYYVDKILKGAKPADLPVEQPTKFELVINIKAAKQIGLTIPPNVLARADKVIK